MIESSKNKLVKQIVGLSSKKVRSEQKLFVAEGENFVSEIPNDWEIISYVLSESYANKAHSIKLYPNVKKIVLKDNIFKTLSDTQTPQGLIAVVAQKEYTLEKIINTNNNSLFLLLEQLRDPGNVGTIIRTADAAGANAVFLSGKTVDIYNPKVLRATMGSIFHIPILQNINSLELIDILKQKNVKIIGTHLSASNFPYDYDLRQSVAIIIGSESGGLSAEIAQKTDCLIKIPMIGKAESLNASIATSILLYEAVRQRVYITVDGFLS